MGPDTLVSEKLGKPCVPLALNAPRRARLHVNALYVWSGISGLFGPGALIVDAVLAYAWEPLPFQAVQIDGESHWHGS